MSITKTAGNWDSKNWPVYFGASSTTRLKDSVHVLKHILVAVNELEGASSLKQLGGYIDNGNAVFVDSGVFGLSTTHAKKHGVTMDVALGMAPDQIDGFDELFERYVTIMRQFGDRLWGYIEIDQGGRENKIKTRERLETMGLRPIPVYHPFNDGWDYFDYLAERYDRICFGNVVQADSVTRRKLIATAWERRRKYPNLWIHALGMTPSETTTAWPINSCDSSTWLSSIRWGEHSSQIANKKGWDIGLGWVYDPAGAGTPTGHEQAAAMCGYDANFMGRNMQVMANDQRKSVGCDIGMFV
jgi:hypothetical protein